MFVKNINFITNEIMMNTLSSLLIEGETLQTPFYAIYEERRQKHNGFCFIGTTESSLLIEVLNVHATRVEWTTRKPLAEIKKVKVKKSLFIDYIIIKITFYDGNSIKIRASTKSLSSGFINQDWHLSCFIERLRDESNKRKKTSSMAMAGLR